MDRSLVSLWRKFIILGLFATATVLFLDPRASATSPGEFTHGLYAQVCLWSEGGDSIDLDFSGIAVTVTGVSTPEPPSLLLHGTGAFRMVALSLLAGFPTLSLERS